MSLDDCQRSNGYVTKSKEEVLNALAAGYIAPLSSDEMKPVIEEVKPSNVVEFKREDLYQVCDRKNG